MQITNIARDIEEDLLRERLYFPQNLLPFNFTSYKKIIATRSLKIKISKNIYKILEMSDTFYQNAWNGIIELPIKHRIPIAIASDLYQLIGKKIEKSRFNVWGNRVYITKFEKFIFSIKTIIKIMFNKKKSHNKKAEKKLNLLLRKYYY